MLFAGVAVALLALADPVSGVTALPVADVVVGERGELSLLLPEDTERTGPIHVWLHSTTVELPHNRLDRRDIVDLQAPRMRLSAVFRAPGEVGEHVVTGVAFFVRCLVRKCRVVHAPVRWNVPVGPRPEPG